MRAVGVHEDAIVVTSRIWQITSTAIRAGGETLESGQKKPTEEVKTLRDAAKLLGVA